MIVRSLVEVCKLSNKMQEVLNDDTGEIVNHMIKMTDHLITEESKNLPLKNIRGFPVVLDLTEDEYTFLLIKYL